MLEVWQVRPPSPMTPFEALQAVDWAHGFRLSGRVGWFPGFSRARPAGSPGGIPHPCANNGSQRGPELETTPVWLRSPGHFQCSGECPCRLAVWPDQQPLEARPSTAGYLLTDPLPLRPLMACNDGPRYWRRTPNPGQRLAAALPGAELPAAPARRSGRPNAVCGFRHTGATCRPLEHAPGTAALLGSRHGRFHHHLWRSSLHGGRSCWRGHLGGGSDQWARFLGGKPCRLGGGVDWLGPSLAAANPPARWQPARTAYLLQAGDNA